jgi:LuxR family maltose regulon positive regulatory protein
MDQWVIQSKLTPSTRLQSHLARDGLVSRLDGIFDARAAVLHAPAGFGKTSLLANWLEHLSAQGTPVAWLSLDDNDKDQFQFLTYLTEACKAGSLIRNSGLYESPSSGAPGSPPKAIVGALLTELNKCTGSHILILDDFHRAETADNCNVINQLLGSLPDSVHLVISTREFPQALALANLRARDELVEIDQTELRFSEREIKTFLGSLVGSPGRVDWPNDLYQKTEGWPIALQTVRRWVSEGASIDETIDHLTGRSSDFSDYFLEQVFDNLSEDVQSFLLKTSILERVTGALANLLCGTTDAWETLEDLERRDLFVQSLDRERSWYRYHRLFSEFLQERLRRGFEGLVPELHESASAWFYEQGHVTEAVQHAIQSRQSIVIATVLEKLGGWHYVLQGHASTLGRALALVDSEDLKACPRLWLGKIFIAARRGEIEQAEVNFDQLSQHLEQFANDDPRLKSEMLILRSILNVYADTNIPDSEVRKLEDLSGSLPHEDHLMHAVRYNILCSMYAQRGRFDECMAAGDKAIRNFRAMDSIWGETFIYFHEGYSCMAQGRLRDAEVLYAAGYDLAAEHFGEVSDLAAIANVFLAEAAYEKNNVREASRLLDLSLSHIEQFDAWLEVYVAAYTTAMKLARAGQDSDAEDEALNRARSIAANRGLPRLRRIVEMQALEFRQRDNGGCTDSDSSTPIRHMVEPANHPILHQLHVSVTARGHVEDGRARLAIELLRQECKACFDAGLIRSFTSLSVLLATVLWDAGEHEAAVSEFEAALSPSLFEGTKRIFIDEGDSLVHVIRDLARASEKRRGNRLRDRFLAELIMEINAARVQVAKNISELSPREQEVLRYLVQGRSNREISESIPISINTVKFHLKNIFEKLNVTTRKDAVSASIRRGIL